MRTRSAAEALLDGLYVLRTPVAEDKMDAAQVVRSYKSLAQVERAFRSLKTVDLKVRPIHHRLADRVRAHIFLCMLAYYVQWHMQETWRALLFADEDQHAHQRRDPVAPAERSAQAELKASTHTLADGSPAHSFRTLLEELSCIVRNTCQSAQQRPRYAYLLHRDATKPRPAARTRTSQYDPRVARQPTPEMTSSLRATTEIRPNVAGTSV